MVAASARRTADLMQTGVDFNHFHLLHWPHDTDKPIVFGTFAGYAPARQYADAFEEQTRQYTDPALPATAPAPIGCSEELFTCRRTRTALTGNDR